ncbi:MULTISPECIES: ectoine/hydroxyectoine ABC transporter permease subunit EhuC [unclassified Rhizobium]|jgi:polar amino acid transport system permease protein|uniref:ectoine/hydroxyectoine ABC transporter permease subunit EhuC n=1 Tax=unclassified Rhizobium TaxID=2613769 RepID=UPI0006472414|nr:MULTISPECIES: ectoine/hydroxyectoine ABC transporter permease subunit EhuC [unclassified Rhizobium]MBN8949170.1 ectoine/hydroxyectoine ABC transporter permease subunit EhuC [Rhizobium tropici]OJY73496.1 MAG: ectoine/hydroxyectoine ABC transporter permease subunit EhuC [Rhizobium sp. 60-20]RKD35484.1 amino acid ABC transporter membrane protein 1 (PAAT family) [Rhizobium sp. WW_1]
MSWTQYLPALLKGAEVTAIIAIASMFFGAILAFAAGLARFAGGRLLSWIAIVYIEIFRGTSLLVQLFWLYYALPLIGISFDPITTGIAGLALNIGAYGAEVVRGALQAVPDTQHEAARALNFGHSQTLFHIVLPQAVVEMMPAFGNLAVQNLKDTALVSLISISDLTFQAQQLRNITLDSVTIYSLTLIGYFIMALILVAFMRWLETALRRGPAFPGRAPA